MACEAHSPLPGTCHFRSLHQVSHLLQVQGSVKQAGFAHPGQEQARSSLSVTSYKDQLTLRFYFAGRTEMRVGLVL